MIDVGSLVHVRPPFDGVFPDARVVVSKNPETGAWQIQDGDQLVDFDETNLQEVT